MKVILLQNVSKLGLKFDIRDVSSGYAANFLLPRGLAETATDAKLKSLETARKKHADELKVQEELLAKNVAALKDAKIVIEAKANDKGHLFKSIHEKEIVEALKKQKQIDLESSMIVLTQPIKSVGEVEVGVKIGEKVGSIKLEISPLS